MKPSPRYRLGDVSDTITAQAREIARLKAKLAAAEREIKRMLGKAEDALKILHQ